MVNPECCHLAPSRQDLDVDHYGLEKLKKRVIEYLAVRQLKNTLKGPILCFVGPPGVGKTSIGRSIAQTLGREFHRFVYGIEDITACLCGYIVHVPDIAFREALGGSSSLHIGIV